VLATGPSHISRIVRRLEGDGPVERTTDPSDGRATLIRFTAAGEAAARGVYALGDRMLERGLLPPQG
jgi:DNA-binding MarR family transcriptional regulator